MHVLRQAPRGNRSPMGPIVPLCHLRQPIWLIPPGFGENADPNLTSWTDFDASRDPHLNRYSDKEDFFYVV